MSAGAMIEQEVQIEDIETTRAGTQSVPAVEKLFAILEVLAISNSGLTLRELAHSCGLPKSSVHGILITLQRCGYLYRNQRTSRYLFARKLLMLANNALSNLELRDRVEPHLHSLARGTGLTAHLGIAEFNEAVIVAKVDPSFSRRMMPSWVGKRMELHCTGLGKALMTNWSEEAIQQHAKNRTLSRHNDNTICSVKRLKEELDRGRRLGYVIDDEEDVLGFRCVGAPIYGPGPDVVAAISVSGSTADIDAEALPAIAAAVRNSASQITQALMCSTMSVLCRAD